MTQLERLSLADVRLTDAGLAHLHGLTNLNYLRVAGQHMTDEAISELKHALPKLYIDNP